MSLRSEIIRIFNELAGAGKKITQLPLADTPLTGTELLEIVQDGVNKKITAPNLSSGGTGVQTIVAGTNISVDDTDPQNPIVSSLGGGGGSVESVTGAGVDNTDTANPVINCVPIVTESNTVISDDGGGWNFEIGQTGTRLANIRGYASDGVSFDGATSTLLQSGTSSINTNTTEAAIVTAAGTIRLSSVSGLVLTDAQVSKTGLKYAASGYVTDPQSLADKEYVDSVASTAPDSSETVKGIIEIATQAEVTTGTDDLRAVTPLKLATDTRGVQDLFVPASAMWPRITGGCSAIVQTEMATSLFNIQSLDFDQTTQEFAQFQLVLPRKWNNGTITAVVYWTATSGSGTVQWGISAGAYRNDDALTVALGTAQTSDDTLLATNDLHISPATSDITVAGTVQDSVFIAVQISRNPASDTLSADAKLLGISFRITTDASIDA